MNTDVTSKFDPKQLSESMKVETDSYLGSVMQAVNSAPDGKWIAASEEQERNFFVEFRKPVFEQAVRQRIDVAEATFLPPNDTIVDPLTKQLHGRRQANNGRQSIHVLTVKGRLELKRRWWHSSTMGSSSPCDALIDGHGETVTIMAAPLNNTSTAFDCAEDNLASTAQVSMSGEWLRKLIITTGIAVLEGQLTGAVPTAFQASDCPADLTQPSGPTRTYAGVDGATVPAITDVEKLKRREKIKHKW